MFSVYVMAGRNSQTLPKKSSKKSKNPQTSKKQNNKILPKAGNLPILAQKKPVSENTKGRQPKLWFDRMCLAFERDARVAVPPNEMIGLSSVSATSKFMWTRSFTVDDVCTQLQFEDARRHGTLTVKPCAYAVAIDVTGYDEWVDDSGVLPKRYRKDSMQIYHVDVGQLDITALNSRVTVTAGIPVITSEMGLEYFSMVAPVTKTAYPDCSPSQTGYLSIGHTVDTNERRLTFVRDDEKGCFRKYLQLGIYSPTIPNDNDVGGPVGIAKLEMSVRALVNKRAGEDLDPIYHKVDYDSVVDFPIYDPAELYGTDSQTGVNKVTIVEGALVNIKKVFDNNFAVAVMEHYLDDSIRDNTIYELQNPIYMNRASLAGETAQPYALRYMKKSLNEDYANESHPFLYGSFDHARKGANIEGQVNDSTLFTTRPILAIKSMDRSGLFGSGGKGLSAHINSAHSGVRASKLRRMPVNSLCLDRPVNHGAGMSDPRVIRPKGVIVKEYSLDVYNGKKKTK